MSHLILSARPTLPSNPPAPTAYPYDYLTTCITPTYDGSGNVTHPSVVDMGRKWNGYRWWLADTPYPGGDDDYENPSIWGSNDRVNWEVPSGLTNPIDPWPGGEEGRPLTAFNSDPELVWDPDGGRMVCYWRDADSPTPPSLDFYAATSTDGHTWTHHPGSLLTINAGSAWRSPGIARVAADDWRMWLMSSSGPCAMYASPGPLGPWTLVGPTTRAGITYSGWHGDFTYENGVFYSITGDDANNGPFRASVSLDGITWHGSSPVFIAGYRATMLPPRNGWVEVWYSKSLNLRYTRVPASYWTDYIPAP